MLGPVDYALWVAGFVLEAAVVVSMFYRGALARYFSIAVDMACTFAAQCAQYVCSLKFGVSSRQYFHFYYYSDALRTVVLFFVVIQLYQHAFAAMGASRYIRGGAFLLLVLTMILSYIVVRQHKAHLTEGFVVELGQDLYFVGTVLTYILWGAMMKLRERPAWLMQLVLALGIYFSATAGTYALRDLSPAWRGSSLIWVSPIAGLWLPVAWTYTFLATPEKPLFVTSRIAVKAQ
ncbi:MAG: hypothetical protein ABR953_13730 [Candidatus Acidiferrales bacterium]